MTRRKRFLLIYLLLLLPIPFFLFVSLAAWSMRAEDFLSSMFIRNMKIALKMYAERNEGKMPLLFPMRGRLKADIHALYPQYIHELGELFSPVDPLYEKAYDNENRMDPDFAAENGSYFYVGYSI